MSVSSDIEVKMVRLYSLDYKGCMSCMACKIKGKASNVCKFKDALTPVLEEIAEADGLVLGSPIYFGDVTGQMRTFLERLAFPWLSYNDYSLTAPKRMPVVLMETMNGLPDRNNMANIHYIRQITTKGLGHAVSRARTFIGDDPFVVMYGDDVIIGDIPATKELIDAYGTFGKGVLGVKKVSEEAIKKYSSLKVENLHDNIFKCTDMIEKPQTKEQIMSLYSILGRCVLPPEIFDILDHIEPGAGGEIQLTDAMAELARTVGMTAVEFSAKRYDMGNKFGILQANIEVGLKHPDTAAELKEYIKELAKTI